MLVRSLTIAVLTFALTVVPGSVHAVTVSGQVTDEQGFGIPAVDLDFFDRNLGQIIFTPGDDTDFNGNYSVTVPPSEYDITFNAPAGSPFLDVEIRVDIVANTVIDVTLPFALEVTGTVTDEGGAPLFNIDLDFYDVAAGNVIDTSLNGNDNTDINGVFHVLVPGATYDVRFIPPVGQPYAARELPGVVVADSMSLGTIVLEPGFFVSGTVVGPTFAPVVDADLDFEDLATGNTIFTPRDNTDGAGLFNTAVAAGAYDIVIAPPTGSGLAWKAVYDVAVSANLALGTVQLQNGYAVTGTVRDESAVPMVGSDLDATEVATGRELPMPNDNTNGSGAFSLLVPATTVDVSAFPPAGVAKAAAVIRDVVVTGPLALGAITLPTGFSVSGNVRAGGVPVADADVDAFDLNDGSRWYPVPHGRSDAAGAYATRLPGGAFLLVAKPPVGSGLFADSVVVSPLDTDVVVDFDLSGGVGAPAVGEGSRLSLLPNAPNPFRDRTLIGFEVPAGAAGARVLIYDTAGRLVRTFDRPGLTPGHHAVTWDGRDTSGRRVASGVYHYRLEAAGESRTRKMLILR